jgi:hypothetical protein
MRISAPHVWAFDRSSSEIREKSSSIILVGLPNNSNILCGMQSGLAIAKPRARQRGRGFIIRRRASIH